MSDRNIEITEDIAARVLSVIDAGLVSGRGEPEPGKMCVEAAVCYALGLPHSDDPQCVSRAVRSLKIRLNDQSWSSPAARAKGLRRLGIAQLGSRNVIDDKEFARQVAELVIRKQLPKALRAVASIQKIAVHRDALLEAAIQCEAKGTEQSARKAAATAAAAADAAYAAAAAATATATYVTYTTYAAADAAAAAAAADAAADAKKKARDESLAEFAEDVVNILASMGAPGCRFLHLTEAA
jgi:hypothetical protein